MFIDQKYKHRKLVVGVGSALVDILVREDDEFLLKTGAIKGGMKYVDKEFIELTMSQASKKPTMVPGGSACNTVIGIGKLGGHARFVGKSGKGKIGGFFEKNLRKNNVGPVLFKSSSFTGRVLSIITHDAQRSMFTFLGASSETQPEEITKKCFENAAIVHIEGYLLFNEDLILAALNAAKEAGALVSLDLASFTVVEESKVLLKKIVKDFVDILLANEDEALAFTGYSDEIKAVRSLSEHTHIAALKVGERGSYIANAGKIIKIEPFSSALGVMIAVIIVIMGIVYFTKESEDKAFALLQRGIINYQTKLKNNTPEKAFLDAGKDFQLIVDKYSNRNGGKLASFIYANICYTAKDYDKAIEFYNKSLLNFNDELFIKSLILNGLGYSYKAKKDYKTAAKYFEIIASSPDYTIKDEALFNLGEIYAAMGDHDKSITAFNKIISDHSGSMYVEIVKERVTG